MLKIMPFRSKIVIENFTEWRLVYEHIFKGRIQKRSK